MSDKPVVILVEDDAAIAELIEYNLRSEGFSVQKFSRGAEMLKVLPQYSDVVLFILDLMLPEMDGFEICRRIRSDETMDLTPIMMLTARSTESDKVRGLEAGADDYVTKPFGIREFLARVNAHVRRKNLVGRAVDAQVFSDNHSPSHKKSFSNTMNQEGHRLNQTIELDGLLLDDVRHRVYLNDHEVEMTNREYELLKFLMTNKGIAYSRDELLNHVWGYEYVGETRTVDVHIRQLRKKIEKDDANPELIETVRGRGYRFKEG
jgi:two-component system alkaline phosphatase synthesis response regulator PhoP